MCDSFARPTFCLNPPALFDVLWPGQSTFPNISLGFPFRFASAIGQNVQTVTEPPSTVSWGKKAGALNT